MNLKKGLLVVLLLSLFAGALFLSDNFRVGLAKFLWIETASAWENKNWNEMKFLCEVVTWLQPYNENYWAMAAWHMAWNAAEDEKNLVHKKKKEECIKCGQQFLEEGIKKNPSSIMLLTELGFLFRDRLQDHVGAARAFQKASQLPGAQPYLHRLAADEFINLNP